MKKLIFILIIILFGGAALTALLASCKSPYERAKKRHERLIERYPALIETDTVTIHDTLVREKKVIVPEYKDSFIVEHDTIIETKKVIIEKRGSAFSVTVKPDTLTFRDTIYHETKVPGKVVRIKDKPNYTTTIIIALIFFILGLALSIFLSRKK